MDISVVVASYGTRELLRGCLRSIVDSAPKVRHEVIVIDNASNDGSAEMVRAEFPAVELVANAENSGFSVACNQGMRLAAGRYLLLLNSDTVMFPGCLDTLVSFADQHLDAGVIGCSHLGADGEPTSCFAYGFLFRRPAKSTVSFRLRNGWVSGAAMLLRRSACDQVGFLDERMFFGWEDVEICWRMKRAGWGVYFCADAQVVHFGGMSSGKGFTPWKFIAVTRGAWLAMRRHGTVVHRVVWYLLLILDITARLFPALSRRDKAAILAFGEALGLPFRGESGSPGRPGFSRVG